MSDAGSSSLSDSEIAYTTESTKSPSVEVPVHSFSQTQQHSLAPSFYVNAHRRSPPAPSPVHDYGECVDTWRSIVIEGLPDGTSVSEVLDIIETGIVEHIRYVPQRNAAAISFLDHQSAALFMGDFILNPQRIRGALIRLLWSRSPPLPLQVFKAVAIDNACRNVYLGLLPSEISEKEIRQDLSVFGTIEKVRMLPEFGIAFVHFLSIASAISAVHNLARSNPAWNGRKVSYGRDRCFNLTKTRKQSALIFFGKAPNDTPALNNYSFPQISAALSYQVNAAISVAVLTGGPSNAGNRCIYIGNLHPDTEIVEICNATRGGLLESVKYLPERHICFVRFAEPTAAANFFATWTMQRLYIHARSAKVAWGRPSGPLPPKLESAISAGATRNVSISDFPSRLTIDEVRSDFAQFGDIEQVSELAGRRSAFLSFLSIQSAVDAVKWAKSSQRYGRTRIRFGKDRCANQPRILQNTSPSETPLPALLQFLQPRRLAATCSAAHLSPPPSTVDLASTVKSKTREGLGDASFQPLLGAGVSRSNENPDHEGVNSEANAGRDDKYFAIKSRDAENQPDLTRPINAIETN